MKSLIIGVAIVSVSMTALAQVAQDPPAQAPSAPASFVEGFCLGWNTAVRMEQIRFGSWSRQMLAGRPRPDPSGVSAVVEGAGTYVTLSELATNIKLDDGTEIDCTPKVDAKKGDAK